MTADPWNDDAQLAAYLAGELDEVTARRIDERLGQDPALGERLDRIHDALLAVRQPDHVTLPEGLEGRLAARLEEEWAASPAAFGVASTASAASGVAPQAAAGASQAAAMEGGGSEQAPRAGGEATRPWHRRLLGGAGGSPSRWQVPVGAAAAVVLVAVAAASMLPLGMNDEAAESEVFRTTDAGSDADSPERAVPEEDAADDEVAELPEDDSVDGDESADLETLEEHGPGEAEDFEGPGTDTFGAPIPRADAPAAADRRWEALARRHSACREDVEGSSPEPVVPVEVYEHRTSEQTVFLFEIVTASEGADTLDETAHVTVDSDTCEVIEYTQP